MLFEPVETWQPFLPRSPDALISLSNIPAASFLFLIVAHFSTFYNSQFSTGTQM